MKYIFLIVTIFITTSLKAQKIGKITGLIKDSTSNIGVDYASVGLYKTGNSKPIDGVVTNIKGEFSLINLEEGEYKVTIDFIGYKRKTIDFIKINETTKLVDLGNILLSSSSKLLKSVTVTANAPIIENKIDKIVLLASPN